MHSASKLLLLRFIGQAQHIEAVITQPPAGVVLIIPDEQPFQLSVAVFVPFRLFSADADPLAAFQPELFHHHCTEMCLMPQNIARHSLNVFQHCTLQDLDPNEVSLVLLLVLAVQRTIKEVLGGIAVVGRAIEHLRTAVGAVDKPRKDAASACAGHSVPLLANLLYLLKHSVLNDTLMGVWKDGLFLDGCFPLLFVPDGVGIGLEVHRTA